MLFRSMECAVFNVWFLYGCQVVAISIVKNEWESMGGTRNVKMTHRGVQFSMGGLQAHSSRTMLCNAQSLIIISKYISHTSLL